MTATPKLGMTHLVEGQAQAEVTVNDAMNLLDPFAGGMRIEDRDLATPPGSPSNGDCYIVAASGTGAWAGQDGKIAVYDSGWRFVTAAGGMVVYIHDEKALFCYSSQESLWFPLIDLWSTTEHWTGRYGSGGTKEYSKVVDIGALPNATTKNVAHSITSLVVAQRIGIDGYVQNGSNVTSVPGIFINSGVQVAVEILVDATNVAIETDANLTSYSGKVRLTYEKSA